MIRIRSAPLFLALTLCACTTTYYARRDWSDEAARSEAQRDIQSGHVKILCAGDTLQGQLGLGITPYDRSLIKEIPRVWLFKNDFWDDKARHYPYTEQARRFGSVYNAEIIEFLKAKAESSQ